MDSGGIMDVERTALPGIGLQHVLRTARGRHIGVVSHRTGRRDLAIYDKDDPDTCIVTVALTGEEANALAELLGTARIVERLAELQRQVDGLTTEQIPIVPGSPYDGRSLGDTQVRSRTGASIVAVVRDRQVVASPRPDFVFAAGDIVVVVGTEEGTAAVAAIFIQG
jgi:K+:H+ antiporter subunit KhtT